MSFDAGHYESLVLTSRLDFVYGILYEIEHSLRHSICRLCCDSFYLFEVVEMGGEIVVS